MCDTLKRVDIIGTVLDIYQSHLQRHDSIEDWIKEDFESESEEIKRFLSYFDLRNAVHQTVSLFEYLDEHGAVHSKVQYPGPTQAFKELAEKIK